MADGWAEMAGEDIVGYDILPTGELPSPIDGTVYVELSPKDAQLLLEEWVDDDEGREALQETGTHPL